jgi:hypothetical protein
MFVQEAASALAAAASQAEADANFSKLYAIVGSMFDSSVSLPEQLSTIEHLPAEQRCGLSCILLSILCWTPLKAAVASEPFVFEASELAASSMSAGNRCC